jgi:hypothetical protein
VLLLRFSFFGCAVQPLLPLRRWHHPRRRSKAFPPASSVNGQPCPSPDGYLQPKKRGFFVDIKATHFIDPLKRPNKILDIGELMNRWPIKWNYQNWIPYCSGNFVPEPAASEIKAAFAERARK